ncbi:uncharacterized protein LOC110098862 [Dendrobium catenatum]|uniref:uncharacterized protein LOC110098862 n=1 Tax=Dendrobium catenatum TaxID=906689 RepID=UPI0009F259E3|nr:uncharacterized protein LOC110098862 [Dendrobium catenatum]
MVRQNADGWANRRRNFKYFDHGLYPFYKTGNAGDFSEVGSGEQNSYAVRGRVYYFGQICSVVVSGTPVYQTCGRRHFGQRYRVTGQCFRCGQPGHQIAECPQAGFDRRHESRSESFARSAGRLRIVPPRTIFEGSSGRAGGSGSIARRPPSSDQRESGSSVAPAPVQSRVYSLNQQEARDAPDVVTGMVYISEYPCRVLFDSGASHSFISERCFDALHLDFVMLPVSLSVLLPIGNNLIVQKFCFYEIKISGKKWKSCLILLLISSYDVILGMD